MTTISLISPVDGLVYAERPALPLADAQAAVARARKAAARANCDAHGCEEDVLAIASLVQLDANRRLKAPFHRPLNGPGTSCNRPTFQL